MRTYEESMVFPPALCAGGCRKPWEKWCRGCNLVFCPDHVERDQHKCSNHDLQKPPAAVERKAAKVKPQAIVPPPKPVGVDLFGPPSTNGVASAPDAH